MIQSSIQNISQKLARLKEVLDREASHSEEKRNYQQKIQALEKAVKDHQEAQSVLQRRVEVLSHDNQGVEFKNPFETAFIPTNSNKILNIFSLNQAQKSLEKEVKSYLSLLNKSNHNISLEAIKEHDRDITIGDVIIRSYYLADIPNYLSTNLLFKLINLPIPLTLTYNIKSTNKGAMLTASRQRKAVLESEQNQRIRKGKSRDSQIDKEIDEVDGLTDDLVYDRERTFLVSIYFKIQATNVEELKSYHQLLQSEMQDIEFSFNTYSFGQSEAFEATLPIGKDTITQDRILHTQGVVNLLPFLTRNLNDPTGIFLGTNHYNGSLILVDLFKARNANINIFGTSGSGKSVTAKLIMARLALRGVQNIILDPEGEYSGIVKAYSGQVVKFDSTSGLNPFYISIHDQPSVNKKISVLKVFFRFFIEPSRYDSAVLDKLLIELYEKVKNPLFKDFITLLHKKKAPFLIDLEKLETGSLSGVFNSDRALNFDADNISFDLSDLVTDEVKIPAMYLLSTLINEIIDQADRQRMIYIDESHKLLVNEETTKFYIDLVKTARKRKAGVVSITQNPEDFKDANGSKTIITQAETSILLKQAYSSMNYIREKGLFALTESEVSILPTLGIGEVLLIREQEHILLDVSPFPSEEELIFT